MQNFYKQFMSNLYENDGKVRAQWTIKDLIVKKYGQAKPTVATYKALLQDSMSMLTTLYPDRTFFLFVGTADKQHPPASTGNEDFTILDTGALNLFVRSMPKASITPADEADMKGYAEALKLYSKQEIKGIEQDPRGNMHK